MVTISWLRFQKDFHGRRLSLFWEMYLLRRRKIFQFEKESKKPTRLMICLYSTQASLTNCFIRTDSGILHKDPYRIIHYIDFVTEPFAFKMNENVLAYVSNAIVYVLKREGFKCFVEQRIQRNMKSW